MTWKLLWPIDLRVKNTRNFEASRWRKLKEFIICRYRQWRKNGTARMFFLNLYKQTVMQSSNSFQQNEGQKWQTYSNIYIALLRWINVRFTTQHISKVNLCEVYNKAYAWLITFKSMYKNIFQIKYHKIKYLVCFDVTCPISLALMPFCCLAVMLVHTVS